MIYADRFKYMKGIKDGHKGYIPDSVQKFLYGDEMFMIIPLQFQYRPDLISRYLYGSEDYAWLLAFINQFENSPKDFVAGTEIIFTNPSRIK